MKKILSSAAILAAILCAGSCTKSYPAKTDDQILDFLDSCGVEVGSGCTKKQIFIPEEFGEVYENYNELQKSQGFDLHDYRSENAVVYTYDVTLYKGEECENTEVHIIVCDDKIIGCDISSPALDGGMSGLL